MRLIPPVIAANTPSPGERLVFQRLAEEGGVVAGTAPAATGLAPGGDWTVLHSFDIADPATRLAAEADFVVVVPGKGVLVLEVKGTRRIRRRSGLWLYGNGRHPDERGPFKQAAEAMHAVRDQLVKEHRELSHVMFWSAVCFPFVDFDETSEEWLPWQVIDRRALRARPLTASLEAVLDRARARLVEHGAPWFHPERGEPDAGQSRDLVAALRGDFEVYESPKARARRLDEEVKRYTREQYEALDAIEANPRIVFDGPAGTGKTLLAIETARRAAAAGRRVLLLCFNRPLGRWLQEETVDLAPAARRRAGVVTRTLHEHMRILAGVTPTPAQACSEAFWRQELPELAQLALLERIERASKDGGRSRYVFDEIVLDETQDLLRAGYLDFLDASVAGGLGGGTWRFFGDFEYQRIYDAAALDLEQFLGVRTGGERDAGRAYGAGAARYNLRINCRNTPSVADLACRCGDVVPGYRRVRRPDDGLEPEIRYWHDADEQRTLLVEVLAALERQGFGGAATAIISPAGDDRCAAAGLSEPPWRDRVEPLVREARLLGEGGLAVDGADGAVADGDWPAACIPSDLDGVELHSGRTRYCSIYRFKGLEAPAVVITDVDALAEPSQRSLLYVGCTRALHRLVILAHASLRDELTVQPS
jgi:hypothetical protein